ncbi:MAG: HNH endonuclease [Gammaproteobacteria bacterium]|nr:HNH endonuclease [Gammaproteobacteria bacterium]
MDLKLIPDTLGFLADGKGGIYSPDGSRRNTYENLDGYITASVKHKTLGWRTFGVHRLTALAFHPVKNPEDLQVNHIDGNVKNNEKHNLEWVNVKENNVHASVLKSSGKSNRVKLLSENGEVRFLIDLKETAAELDVSEVEVWNSIKERKPLKGFVIEHAGKNITKSNVKDKYKPYLTKLKAKSVDTGEEVLFDGNREAAKYFRVSRPLLAHMMSDNIRFKLLKGEWLVVYQEQDYPVYNEEMIEEARSHGRKEVYVVRLRDGKKFIYPSAASFIRDFNLSKKAISTRLKKNKLEEVSGFVFLYFNDVNVKLIKDFLDGPAEKK